MAIESYKIVILKCKPQSLISVEQYLANRDWEVHSTSSLKAAIGAMIKAQPDYVFIAADHSNKKVRLLPKLIAQALKLNVIGFIESSTPFAMQALNDFKLDYILFPPLSGPSVERLINRIKKDELRAVEQADRDAAREKEHSTTHENPAGDPENGEFVSTEAVAKKRKGQGFYMFTGEKKNSKNRGEGDQEARKLLEELLSDESKSDDSKDQMVLIQKDPSQLHEYDPGADEGTASSASSESSGRTSDQDEKSPFTDRQPMASSGRPNTHTFQGPKPKEKMIKVGDFRKSAPLASHDSILVQGAQAAMDESAHVIDGLQEVEQLQSSSQVACVVVESERFSGYLVAAMGENRTMDAEFIESVKTKLIEFLKKHGETVKSGEDGMDLRLEEVDFEDWAVDQAEFLRKSIHGGNEVAMAFFPNPHTQIRLEQSANENMLQMDIGELKEDIPVEFDMYIYMPTNNKYLLYTPQGRKMAGEQKGRLIDKGVQKIHLRKDSEGQVKKYRAQVFLNDKIAAYRNAAKKKAN